MARIDRRGFIASASASAALGFGGVSMASTAASPLALSGHALKTLATSRVVGGFAHYLLSHDATRMPASLREQLACALSDGRPAKSASMADEVARSCFLADVVARHLAPIGLHHGGMHDFADACQNASSFEEAGEIAASARRRIDWEYENRERPPRVRVASNVAFSADLAASSARVFPPPAAERGDVRVVFSPGAAWQAGMGILSFLRPCRLPDRAADGELRRWGYEVAVEMIEQGTRITAG